MLFVKLNNEIIKKKKFDDTFLKISKIYTKNDKYIILVSS